MTDVGVVYGIRDRLSGETVYVGQTRRTMEIRWRQHNSGRTPITAWLKFMGVSAFEVYEIERVIFADLNVRETYWILTLNTLEPHGLNQLAGGRGTSHSPRSRKKMSDVMKEVCARPDKRAAIIARNRKLWADPEYRARQAKGKAAVQYDPAYLKNMSAARVEVWQRPGNKEKLAAATKSQWADPEQRAIKSKRIREALKTPEERARRAANARAMWENPEYRAKMQAAWQANREAKRVNQV